jgi:hypothetical protein
MILPQNPMHLPSPSMHNNMHPILVTVAVLSATNYRRYARLTYILVLLQKIINCDVNKHKTEEYGLLGCQV